MKIKKLLFTGIAIVLAFSNLFQMDVYTQELNVEDKIIEALIEEENEITSNRAAKDYHYEELEDGTLEITEYTGHDTKLLIPTKIDGKRVTSIGSAAFSDNINIEIIKLPETISNIKEYAFYGCSSLRSIELPGSITSIENMAFYDCSSLRSIELPGSINSIGDAVFIGCKSLTSITVNSDNLVYASKDGILYDKNIKTIICCPGRKKGSIKLPISVASIGNCAFAGCSKLSSIKLPGSLTIIGFQAFAGCSNLNSIELPENVTSIGSCAFQDCSSLSSIKLSEGVTRIEKQTFWNCSNLNHVKLPQSIISLGYGVFLGCNSLSSIKLPKNITNIEDRAFEGCSSDLTLSVIKDSYAESYAKENGLKYNYFIVCDHDYQVTITKATTKKDGTYSKICTKCGDIEEVITIYAVKTVKLSETSYTYNGKVQKPTVTIKDSNRKNLKNKTDYTISYPKNIKNIGSYTATIKLKGNYSGTIKKIFTIIPKGTSILKITPKKKGFTVKWKKQATQTTGYEIAYSTNSKFSKKNTKIVSVEKNNMTSKSLNKLKAKKKYYLRIRTYKTIKGKKYYSHWSKAKHVITKK